MVLCIYGDTKLGWSRVPSLTGSVSLLDPDYGPLLLKKTTSVFAKERALSESRINYHGNPHKAHAHTEQLLSPGQ
jgi:hypothetical protein